MFPSSLFKRVILLFILLLPLFVLSFSPLPANAQGNKKASTKTESTNPAPPKAQEKTNKEKGEYTSTAIPNYISNLYQFAIYAAAILAVVMIMVGGFLWLTSAGNQAQVGRAREYISSAFIGLLLALGSYLILYTINPNLTILGAGKPLPMPSAVTGLGPNTSCEALVEAGFTVTPIGAKEATCDSEDPSKNTKGMVTNSPPGKVFPGTTCTYSCKKSGPPVLNSTDCACSAKKTSATCVGTANGDGNLLECLVIRDNHRCVWENNRCNTNYN